MTKPAAEIGCAFCGAYVVVDDAAMARGISWQCDCPDAPALIEERSSLYVESARGRRKEADGE